ncbi:hypothetical protein M8C17_19795 [Micromonospora sp. RHAY321]|uniref:hypothetical protein n=1 Tax=Micromonospora sp. RHAY321 TaxID=2944807 RepID=UPI00207C291F|nr:hypothetical protein [Micromonospora sp. RHAY321]MCO1597399.1 hypothetical protein [Micromonospora sp. RHAY321]
MRTRLSIVALATAVTLTAIGCGSDINSSPSVTATTAVAAPTAAPTPAAPHDAKTVLAALTAAKVGLSGGAVQSEDTDPNDLLGRPNGYLSRASADMPGGDRDGDKYGIERGLVIEVFPTAADADRRSKFIQDTLKSMQILGTEYHYRAGGGAVLVRVSGKVKPSVAKKVQAAVATL